MITYSFEAKNEAFNTVNNLVNWLKENRDLSNTVITDNELEALQYLLDTYNY